MGEDQATESLEEGGRETELHVRLHEAQGGGLSAPPTFKSHPRLQLLPYAESILGRKIGGEILDLGAGNGYASCWVAMNRDARVTALECTEAAVNDNIPASVKACGVNDVHPELGSFTELERFAGTFDFAIAFGALHHSPDLFEVLRNVYLALKPGGILIMQEPVCNDRVDNGTYRLIYDAPERFAGELIRHGDRHDHFFRRCEYLTALHFNGFDILHEEIVDRLLSGGRLKSLARLLLRALRSRAQLGAEPVAPEDFARYRVSLLSPESWLVVVGKPLVDREAPHVWQSLRRP